MNGAVPPRIPAARVREAGKHKEAREWAKVGQLSVRQTPGWGRGTCTHRSAYLYYSYSTSAGTKSAIFTKDLLKFTWLLDNKSNYRKLYLQWAAYFPVQRNKVFVSCSLPLPVTAVEGNVFLNGALSGSEITEDWRVSVGGWDSNLQSVWRANPARPPHALLSAFGVSLYFLSLNYLFVFYPSYTFPVMFCVLFLGFILHLVVFLKNKQTFVTGFQ